MPVVSVIPRLALLALSVVAAACSAPREAPSASSTPARSAPISSMPAFAEGEFLDDYGIRYSIQPHAWTQHPTATYHITDWSATGSFAVAQNDAENPTDAGLWTRIDWVRLDGAGGYDWAYCYAVYDAATRVDAITAEPSNRDSPRTGCHGFPFSRMARVAPSDG